MSDRPEEADKNLIRRELVLCLVRQLEEAINHLQPATRNVYTAQPVAWMMTNEEQRYVLLGETCPSDWVDKAVPLYHHEALAAYNSIIASQAHYVDWLREVLREYEAAYPFGRLGEAARRALGDDK